MKETYEDLLGLIDINEKIKNNCKESLRMIQKAIYKQGPQGYKSSTSYLDADCIHSKGKKEMYAEDYLRLLDGMSKLNNMIFLQNSILKNLYKTKKEIDIRLNKLKGINYKVAYLKLVKGETLRQIASELHISEIYAKKISARI